jgi:hypothetical protein
MSLLTICQDVAYEIGFPAPATIISNSDANAKQLLRLANREGKILSRATSWQALKSVYTFTLATADQDYVLPTDFGWIIPSTTWNRTTKCMVLNPVTPQEWEYLQAWSGATGLNLYARIIGSQLVFQQTITAAQNGETIAYEYISSKWCQSALSVAAAAWAADTDTAKLDEELITQGIVWRFKKSKGLEWKEDFVEYENQRNRLIARDGGMRKLNFGGGAGGAPIGVNVPDQGYG